MVHGRALAALDPHLPTALADRGPLATALTKPWSDSSTTGLAAAWMRNLVWL